MKAWIDGQFVPAEQATVPILSHAVGRGSTIFEVMEVVEAPAGPALFRAGDHVARFARSAELMHMALPLGGGELVEAIRRTVRHNGISAGVVKLFGYYALPELGLIPARPRVSVAVFCFHLADVLGGVPGSGHDPVAAALVAVRKLGGPAVRVHAKVAGHYVNAFLARVEAAAKGCDDAIMLDASGHVAEGPLANVFFVRDGVVTTPKADNVLLGITRSSVIEIAADARLDFAEADIPPEQALAADEAFYTGSVIRIKPIRSIDGRALGGGCPGPVTARIRAALNDAYEGRDPRYRKWLTAVGASGGGA